ncbi:LAETG motif-containing sortase-dependent surface protein [Streptomyces sp. NPDC046924]|uniref:LAETG motif-containing sortase-dependent surface protein n=1 Tax=Streptomyces sp. NPDC046924 TaxID=3155136 RepID=UPI0033E4795F
MSYLKRAVVTAVATGALAAIAVPAWATAESSATPSAAPSPVTSLPPNATPSAAPTPDASLPADAVPSAAPSVAPTPDVSLPPNDAKPIPDVSNAPGATQSSAEPELAHTGSDSTAAAIGAGAAGLVALGGGALFVVRRRALR